MAAQQGDQAAPQQQRNPVGLLSTVDGLILRLYDYAMKSRLDDTDSLQDFSPKSECKA